MAYMRLGDLLITAGAITPEQLDRALELQKSSTGRLGDVLIEKGFITEKQLIEALQMQLGVDYIDLTTVSIPLETVTEITESGVSKTYDRKVYPGYVLVKMVYSDDTWHVIRNVRGVTGFVGTSSNDPTPLTDEEIYAMGVEKKEIIVSYKVGDTVRIMDGPLSSFTGTVESIDVDNNSVNVVVSMFGRETTVEFELDQVEVVSQ